MNWLHIILLVVIAAMVVFTVVSWVEERRRTRGLEAEIARGRASVQTLAHLNKQMADLNKRAHLDLEWARIARTVAESERDMYATALRGLLTNQARKADNVVTFGVRNAGLR